MSKGTPTRAIRIEDDLWEEAKAVAIRRSDTLTDVIRGALESYVAGGPARHAGTQPVTPTGPEQLTLFEATTTRRLHLNRADMEAYGQTFEPGLSVTAIPLGAQLWHLTAAAEGCVWEGLASSGEIEGATFLANVRGNDIP